MKERKELIVPCVVGESRLIEDFEYNRISILVWYKQGCLGSSGREGVFLEVG